MPFKFFALLTAVAYRVALSPITYPVETMTSPKTFSFYNNGDEGSRTPVRNNFQFERYTTILQLIYKERSYKSRYCNSCSTYISRFPFIICMKPSSTAIINTKLVIGIFVNSSNMIAYADACIK